MVNPPFTIMEITSNMVAEILLSHVGVPAVDSLEISFPFGIAPERRDALYFHLYRYFLDIPCEPVKILCQDMQGSCAVVHVDRSSFADRDFPSSWLFHF